MSDMPQDKTYQAVRISPWMWRIRCW